VVDSPDGFRAACGLATPGGAARTNAALAIACVRALGEHPDADIARACRTGLAGCTLPGRVERLAADPLVIVDSSHTARSIADLVDSLGTLAPGGFDLALSVSADKALDDVIAPLILAAGRGRIVTTRAEPARGVPADMLAKRIEELAERLGLGFGALDVRAIEDPEEALRVARASLDPGRMLCATGSVYLAGVARQVLGGAPPR